MTRERKERNEGRRGIGRRVAESQWWDWTKCICRKWWSREAAFCRPLLPSPSSLVPESPQKPRKSRRKKYGKIENFPIAEEIPPQLAQQAPLLPLPNPERFPPPRHTPRQQIMTCMNCVLKRRVSKQNDDIKAESSTKRGYMNGLKYCIHARAVPHTNTSPISRPPHATGVTSLPRTTNSLSAPRAPIPFYKRNPQGKRKEDETQRILTRGKYKRISSHTPRSLPSPSRDKCRI